MKLGKNSFIGIGLIVAAVVLALLINSIGARIMELNSQGCGCGGGSLCPSVQNTLPIEVYVGYTTSAVLILLGIYLIFSDLRTAKLKSASAENWKRVTSALQGDEKTVYELVASADGVMFQSEIGEKSGLQKVKVSRVLDRLEARNLLERRRRGMSNVVVLKPPL